jgi:hypothetical protein
MPRDDQAFFADISAADQEFRAASAENLIVIGDDAHAQLVRFQHYYSYFQELGRISGGTEPIIEKLELRILPRLEDYGQDNTEGPIANIREKLGGWQGPAGSASYGFKFDYLPRLATALENKYSIMQALAAVLITHEAIIDRARQKYLDLIDNTTAAIGQDTSERSSSGAEVVVSVVGAVASGLAISVAVGPVAGTVFGAIQGIGGVIDATATEPGGDDWWSITNDALDKLEAIATAVREETRGVESALDRVLIYVNGEFQDEFLAPPVNLGPVNVGWPAPE